MDIVSEAYNSIKKYIYKTPIIYSPNLSSLLGHKIYLKLDSMQITGSFKVRGVLNFLLEAKRQNSMPSKLVAYSTGNHGIAMGYAAKLFNIKARIYLPQYVSNKKKELVKLTGAEIIEVSNRAEAEKLTQYDAENGYTLLPPSDSDLVIAGAGTMCYEALTQLQQHYDILPDAIFAPCGGGGLLSGSLIAKNSLAPNAKLYGVEPEQANDAHQSVKNKKKFRFEHSPETSADGLRALSVSDKTLSYLYQLDDIYLVEEQEISCWNRHFNNLYPMMSELSATISLSAVKEWAQSQSPNQKILVLITGGNF